MVALVVKYHHYLIHVGKFVSKSLDILLDMDEEVKNSVSVLMRQTLLPVLIITIIS